MASSGWIALDIVLGAVMLALTVGILAIGLRLQGRHAAEEGTETIVGRSALGLRDDADGRRAA
jgi:hypothetical protein